MSIDGSDTSTVRPMKAELTKRRRDPHRVDPYKLVTDYRTFRDWLVEQRKLFEGQG